MMETLCREVDDTLAVLAAARPPAPGWLALERCAFDGAVVLMARCGTGAARMLRGVSPTAVPPVRVRSVSWLPPSRTPSNLMNYGFKTKTAR